MLLERNKERDTLIQRERKREKKREKERDEKEI
jgi:hypothetical protein